MCSICFDSTTSIGLYCQKKFCEDHYPAKLIQFYDRLEPNLPKEYKLGHICRQYDSYYHSNWMEANRPKEFKVEVPKPKINYSLDEVMEDIKERSLKDEIVYRINKLTHMKIEFV